ncbi:MAG: response regulator [Candidatus Omnitrophica bacterium]|nr:response regulator [Candidatus Omnitrophota bacterium]
MDKKRILIVDDEVDATDMLKMHLERVGGFEVRAENRGSMGYSAAKEFSPDLVLLDLTMPDMDGSEVAAMIKDDPQIGKTPIVFLTASILKEEAEETQGSGDYSFLAKPAGGNEVIEKINRVLGL